MMKTLRILLVFSMILATQAQLYGQEYPYLSNPGDLTGVTQESGITVPVTVTVVYDNYIHTPEMKPDWGYSIVIEGLEKTVLFDAGTKPDIFKSNFEKTGLNASSIDLLVFSHQHYDHVGGIEAFAKMKTGIPVIIPHSFTHSFIKSMADDGFQPVLARDATMICRNLYTSGEFDFQIPEQCLILDTKDGLVVMTGCSHPGIVRMLKEIRRIFNKDIAAVFGGFHLMNKSKQEMEEIIREMKALGVVKCGATHCTGDQQIKMFSEAFGDNYFRLGVGNTIVFQ